MVVESVKKVKNIVSEVFKGYASNSSGGCCGVSLPPEEQRQLKRLKEGRKGPRPKRKIDRGCKNGYTKDIRTRRTTGTPPKVSDVVRFYFATRGVYHAVSIERKENELSL